MFVPQRMKSIAAVASASALLFTGAGAASAQGSIPDGVGSSAPVFDSESEAALVPLGEGAYTVSYSNGSGRDLACVGVVLPEAAAEDVYETMQEEGFSLPGGGGDEDGGGDGDGDGAGDGGNAGDNGVGGNGGDGGDGDAAGGYGDGDGGNADGNGVGGNGGDGGDGGDGDAAGGDGDGDGDGGNGDDDGAGGNGGSGDDNGDPDSGFGGLGFGPELDEANKNGHIGYAIGKNGLTLRQYLRSVYLLQVAEQAEHSEEESEVPSGEEINATVDGMLQMYFSFLGEGVGDRKTINHVDNGESAQWTATMDEALPEGDRAGGIVFCFDGVGRDAEITESTYLEVEDADETAIPNPGGNDDDDDDDVENGTLPSGIFGSIERLFS